MEPPVPNMPAPPPPTRAPRSYALRFISGKYQGGEFPLPEEGEIIIGRSSELDMVLVEDMVSRRHSKITVHNGQIFIQDLGSTNGTFVNGEKIQRARLAEGDRILVGTSIIKVVSTETGMNAHEARQHLRDVSAGQRSQVRTMTGDIAEVPLPDLLQLFSASKKSGVLVVSTDTDAGRIYLDKGRVVFASVNDEIGVSPAKSFYRILTWQRGTFDMEPPDEARQFPEMIEMSTEALLMEAMRQIDEVRRLGPDMPPLESHLSVQAPLIPPLRELLPDELDVLQLAHNYGQVAAVLDKSLATDLATSEIVVKLIKAGYLKAE